ncbi:MAG: hypothetical protein V3S34_04285, partial [Hyphomicrobium sp.]
SLLLLTTVRSPHADREANSDSWPYRAMYARSNVPLLHFADEADVKLSTRNEPHTMETGAKVLFAFGG